MKMVLDLMLETVLHQYSLHYFATVTLVTQGLQSSFLSCSMLRPPFFSGQLLFFSFYCEGVWGWCLMPLGEPGPVTPLFAIPLFFSSSTCRLVWVGATHRVVMVTFQAQLQCLSDLLRTFPTLIYCHWAYMFLHLVIVTKCYSGSSHHH